MHPFPLNVAVYPELSMSRGIFSSRLVRPSSTSSSSSSSSSVGSSRTHTSSPTFSSIQEIICTIFPSPNISVRQIVHVGDCLHQVYSAQLFDGVTLVLKCPPAHNIRLLRHEKHQLETEHKTLETLHQHTKLPVPQVLKYENTDSAVGIPFLLVSHIPGRRLSDIATFLTCNERYAIDRTLGSYVKVLAGLSATQFGMTHRVFAKKGCSTWREAFLALLEASLRDAEDMLVTVPYESIRYYVGKNCHFLDEVTEPRLVAVNACNSSNVIIDERTKQVAGLVGFSNVLWGDPLMNGGIADGTDAFFEGFGQCPARIGGVKARLLMYTIYRATLAVVAQHYRPQMENDESEARRSLSYALNGLAQIEAPGRFLGCN